MTPIAAHPAGSLVSQRIKTLKRLSVMLGHLDHVQLIGDAPAALTDLLRAPRYRDRLERRFARRTGVLDIPGEMLSAPVQQVAALGLDGVRYLIVDAGSMCHYAALRRIVDQSLLTDISAQTGLEMATHEARKATDTLSLKLARALAVPEPSDVTDSETIIHAILADGLHCWNCWVHSHPTAIRRFLEALLPILPGGGTNIAGGSCTPRECRRRAELFDARIKAAYPNEDEALQESE